MRATISALFVGALIGCGGAVHPDPPTVVSDSAADDTILETSLADTSTAPDTTVSADVSDTRDTARCGGPQCANGLDDDGDGLVDWLDPECTGPLDNDESSFSRGIYEGDWDGCRTDCWFDGNIGSGDDGCYFPFKCLAGTSDPRCPYDPVAVADPMQCPTASEKCTRYCGRWVPNGCDCAGCCDVYNATGLLGRVRLMGTCTVAKIGDPKSCPPCEKRLDCNRPCNRCDYCLGKTKLPSDCTDSMKTACPTGSASCDPSTPCPCGQFCLTGCCVTA